MQPYNLTRIPDVYNSAGKRPRGFYFEIQWNLY